MNKKAGVDWSSVAQMLTGGAALGLGTGAAVTFMKHLHELQENARPMGEDANDPNVLYLDLPAKTPAMPRATSFKRASANPNANTASTFALSSLAGLVGAGLAYSTVHDVYNRRRRREVENELSQAQHVYLVGMGAKAASQYSMPTKLVGSGYLALLMTALGSAVVAKKMLDKRFPPIENPTAGQPRKIVIRSVDPVTHKPINAGSEYPGSVSPNAMEGLVRTQMADTKMASYNEVKDVVAALASGRYDEVKALINTAGVDGMLDGVKGAALRTTDPVQNNLAISLMCHDPLIANSMAPIVAAEFFKSASWTFELLPKLASLGLDEEHLVGLVEASAEAVRGNILKPVFSKMASVKSAEEMGGHGLSPMGALFFVGGLHEIMKDPNRDEMSEHNDQNVSEGEETAGPARRSPRAGMDVEVSDDAANRFAKQHLPAIDQTLARQV